MYDDIGDEAMEQKNEDLADYLHDVIREYKKGKDDVSTHCRSKGNRIHSL